MRTPEEQRRIVEKVLAVWAKFPHQRLCQLVTNARIISGKVGNSADPFYEEDRDLVLALEKYASEHRADAPKKA